MSLVHAESEALVGASAEWQSINAAVSAGNAAASVPTTGVVPAASDLVSILTAGQFANHAKMYQQISAQAAQIHQSMATTLGLNGVAYAATEASNASDIG